MNEETITMKQKSRIPGFRASAGFGNLYSGSSITIHDKEETVWNYHAYSRIRRAYPDFP